MITKKNTRLLTTVTLAVIAIVFGVCGCNTEVVRNLKYGWPTPTATPHAGKNAWGPGPKNE
ncbi:MAG: hypothetical protein WA849_15735 [Candidatus Udaeobacter sp.]